MYFGCKYKFHVIFPLFYCITDNISIHRSVYKWWSSKACTLKIKYHEGLCVSVWLTSVLCLAHLQLCSHAGLMSSSAETDPASTASSSATKYKTASTKVTRLAVSMVNLGVCVCVCVCVLLCTNLLCCLFSRVKCIPEIELVPPFNATPFKV